MQENSEWFAQQNLTEFEGEWVAVVACEVVARGNDLADVLRRARKARPGLTPFVTSVPAGLVTA